MADEISKREVLDAMPMGLDMTAREIAKRVLGPNAKGHWISGTLLALQGEFLETKPSTYAGSKKYRKIAELPPPKVKADPNLVQVEAGGAKVTMPRMPIDLNFLVTGVYSQLPGDVQDEIFSRLIEVHASSNLLENSGPRQTALRLQET